MSFWFFTLALLFQINFGFTSDAFARPFYYLQARYVSGTSESMSGILVPLSEEAGNALMNNPAALARYSGYRIEPLNLNFVANKNNYSIEAELELPVVDENQLGMLLEIIGHTSITLNENRFLVNHFLSLLLFFFSLLYLILFKKTIIYFHLIIILNI